jgi:hypothetical protein
VKEVLTIWYQSFHDLAPKTRSVKEIMADLDLKDQLAAIVATMREQNNKLEAKLDGISGEMAVVKGGDLVGGDQARLR